MWSRMTSTDKDLERGDRHIPRQTEGNRQQVRITRKPAEIRSRYLPHASHSFAATSSSIF